MSICLILLIGVGIYWLYKTGKLDIFLAKFKNYFRGREYVDKDVEYNRRKNSDKEEQDRILDKISKVGYKGITREERLFLKKKK